MISRRLLTVSPDHEPLWVRLYIHQVGDRWAAMILADDAAPPEPGTVKGLGLFGATPDDAPPPEPRSLTGLAFFGDTPEEAEQAAKAYLGCAEPTN